MEAPSPTLSPGQRGPSVRDLQAALTSVGLPVSPDGSYGPRTAEAVRALQRRAGLPQDGVYGRATYDALRRIQREASAPATSPQAPKWTGGLWVDTLPRAVPGARGLRDWDGWAKQLLATGCKDFSLAAFGSAEARYDSAFWDGRTFACAVQALKHHGGPGVTVGALVWLTRSSYKAGVRVWTLEAEAAKTLGHPLDYVELDAEEGWATARELDARELVTRFDAETLGLPLRLTCIPHNGRTMRPSERYLVEAILRRQSTLDLAPQIYSAYLPDKAWTHSAGFRPGVFQDICGAHYLPQIKASFGDKIRILYGTAVYGQSHPKPSPQGLEALDAALDAAHADRPVWAPGAGPAPLRFWSSGSLDAAEVAWMHRALTLS